MSFQANAFQNDAFQVDVADVVVATVGAGGVIVRHRAGDELRAPGQFTRKRFDEFMAAERAGDEAEARARELSGKKRKALTAAARAADDALLSLREQESDAAESAARADLERMAAALRAASAAGTLAEIVAQARAAVALARAIAAHITQVEDEEDAMAALLMA